MSTDVPSEPATSNDSDAPSPARNLPVPVRDGEVLRPAHDNWLVRAIRTLFGWRSGSLRADLQVVLEASAPDETSFSATERTMLRNILGLRERRIADVMVQRADIVAVRQDITLGELMKLFESAAHSRLVVYRDTLDDPEGMVHIRDLLAYVTSRAQVDPTANTRRKKPFTANLDLRSINLAMSLEDAGIVRKLLYVPPSMPALDLLAQMQATRIHLALVVDEYGGTDGLVSIEDLVEQIVGEIDDEHDDDTPPSIVKQPDNSFIADARAPIEDVITTVGQDFDLGDAASNVDTLGGYLVAHVGRLPVRGEVISGPGPFEIEVLDADPRRVKRLRISLRKERPTPRMREQRRRETPLDAAPATPRNDAADIKPSNDTPPSGSPDNPTSGP
jgi:CBS domain containing-hemolysin-like protein